MAKRDYYDVLGVPKNATEDDIKKAYRKLAMKHHPDRNQGDTATKAEERFKEAKEAYEMLSDPHKRAAYDQHGHAGVDRGTVGAADPPGIQLVRAPGAAAAALDHRLRQRRGQGAAHPHDADAARTRRGGDGSDGVELVHR